MLFNSLHFFYFFIIVVVTYFIIPHKFRWFLLLSASCYFYMIFKPIYILILGFTIVIDYFAGILIESSTGNRKKIFLITSLVANLGVLAIFKYYNFFDENLSVFLQKFNLHNPLPLLSILLPVGLSFHTFQAMSYTIEVYRGNQAAERHFGIYALYVMFFPQLVAGPIERPQNLLHQFREEHQFDYTRVTNGIKLMIWGLFKKVVIADRLALLTDQVYDHPTNYNGLALTIATLFFTFQIFCDFSGYSDMAIGAAKVMGFTLMKNFDNPYSSTSIPEFWRRWHISLSTWFKDYLYIPLGGNRVAVPRWYFNLFIVFLVSGFWHGASWNFIIWGALHGIYMILSAATTNIRKGFTTKLKLDTLPRVNHFINLVFTFSTIAFTWIFFRANHLSDALYISTHLFNGWRNDLSALFNGGTAFSVLHFQFSTINWIISISAILIMEIIHGLQDKIGVKNWLEMKNVVVRWSIYYAIIIAILFLGVFEQKQFIYFQF